MRENTYFLVLSQFCFLNLVLLESYYNTACVFKVEISVDLERCSFFKNFIMENKFSRIMHVEPNTYGA